jgi:nicotinamidase-related amidase
MTTISLTTAIEAAQPRTLLEIAGVHATPARLAESVVIIIDAQQDYTKSGRLPLAHIDTALDELHRLLERSRAAGVPIIHIQQVSPPGRGVFAAGSPGAEFAAAAQPRPGESVISKRLPNAFAGTALDETLRRLGRKHLVIAGYMTHMCVSATARSAIDHGYHVTIVAAACTTRDLPDTQGGVIAADVVHRVALAELADRFATVVSTVAEIAD